MSNGFGMQLIILGIFFVGVYFLLIRPQKKKEKAIADMRNSVQVGDEIVTIGGICGKVVKTKSESLIIQVGSDKTKFEVMRWSVSNVVNKGKVSVSTSKETEEEQPKKFAPKRLKKEKKEEVEIPEKDIEQQVVEDVTADNPETPAAEVVQEEVKTEN